MADKVVAVLVVLAFFCMMMVSVTKEWKIEACQREKEELIERGERIRKDFETKLSQAESEVARLRAAESRANADLKRMRSTVSQLQRDAKDAKGRDVARCAELATECGELLVQARPLVGGCAKVLE